MFLQLYHMLRGYVRIEVTGFGVERFINMSNFRQVHFWKLQRQGNQVYMNVSVAGFRELKYVAKKTECKIRIMERKGLPFILFTYRKRSVMMVGLLVFVATIFALTNFIWLVEIEGNERIETREMLDFVKDLGLYRGVFKPTIDRNYIERNILYHYNDFAFLHIEVKGSRAIVHLSETMEEAPLHPAEPSHLIAKKDGFIMSVATQAGKPLVREGDIVKKGDMLISGELDVGVLHDTEMTKRYVHAQGEVKAKIYYTVEIEIPLEVVEKEYTGAEKTVRILDIGGSEWSVGKPSIKYEKYDRIIDRWTPYFGENYPLPIDIITVHFREFTEKKHIRSIEEAKVYGERAMTMQTIREYGKDLEIIDQSIEFEALKDTLIVRSIFATIEQIGESIAFLPEAIEIDLEDTQREIK